MQSFKIHAKPKTKKTDPIDISVKIWTKLQNQPNQIKSKNSVSWTNHSLVSPIAKIWYRRYKTFRFGLNINLEG